MKPTLYLQSLNVALIVGLFVFTLHPGARNAGSRRSLQMKLGQPKKIRVLCYGDSLTYGKSKHGSRKVTCPYSDYLQQTLEKTHTQTYQVDHIGHVGLSTARLIDFADEQGGIRGEMLFQKHRADIVIIMAGTNDLPHQLHPDEEDDGVIKKGAEQITQNLLRLHQMALASGALQTIAVGLPPSRFQEEEPVAAKIAKQVNHDMRYQAIHSGKMNFAPFPFRYRGNESYWVDSLHCSCDGYAQLGEALASAVLDMLE